MSGDIGIGRILPHAMNRDAVHIAVLAAEVESPYPLRAGTPVALAGRKIRPTSWPNSIGVVDPFLIKDALPGQICWVFMRPGSIESLRHEWTHPAVSPDPLVTGAMSAAEGRLRAHAEEINMSYVDFLHMLDSALNGGDTYVGDDAASDYMNSLDQDRLAVDFKAVTGKPYDANADKVYFRCAC